MIINLNYKSGMSDIIKQLLPASQIHLQFSIIDLEVLYIYIYIFLVNQSDYIEQVEHLAGGKKS